MGQNSSSSQSNRETRPPQSIDTLRERESSNYGTIEPKHASEPPSILKDQGENHITIESDTSSLTDCTDNTILQPTNGIEHKSDTLDDDIETNETTIDFEQLLQKQAKMKKSLENFKKEQNTENFLDAVSCSINYDPDTFTSWRDGINKMTELNQLFKQLRESGISEDCSFASEMNELISLLDKQWTLLHETLKTLSILGNKCEQCQWNIIFFKNALKDDRPDMNQIGESMDGLKEWIEYRFEMTGLVDQWRQYMNELRQFQVKWDRVKNDVIKAIEDKFKDDSHNIAIAIQSQIDKLDQDISKNKRIRSPLVTKYNKYSVLSAVGIVLTCSAMVVSTILLPPLAIPLFYGAIATGLGTTSCVANAVSAKRKLNANMKLLSDKTTEKEIAETEMRIEYKNSNEYRKELVSTMVEELGNDVKMIRDNCEKLDIVVTEQVNNIELICKYIPKNFHNLEDKTRLQKIIKIDEKLTEMLREFKGFQKICNDTAKIIKEKKARLVGN